ncbi:MAG: hypothetical protein ACTSWC_01265 [Promethearchaeota archaeon]
MKRKKVPENCQKKVVVVMGREKYYYILPCLQTCFHTTLARNMRSWIQICVLFVLSSKFKRIKSYKPK